MVKENKDKLDLLLSNEQKIDLILSYSRISDFDRNGPKVLINKTIIDNIGTRFGTLVEDILSDISFHKKYHIFDGEKPTATLGKLVDIILKEKTSVPNIDEVFDIIKHNGFWSNTKDPEKILPNFDTKDFWGYLECQYKYSNKKIITSDIYENAVEIASILRTHEYSRNIFYNDYKTIDQFEFTFEYKNFKFRGIIDKLMIDFDNKLIYMVDLKTGSNSYEEFDKSFIDYRYYFQESIYTLAFEEICKKLDLEGFKLMPFQFLYISKNEKIPILWKVSEKWHKAALNGFRIGRNHFKGLNEILDEIYYYWKNNCYELPKEVIENNGSLFIKDNFIEIDE